MPFKMLINLIQYNLIYKFLKLFNFFLFLKYLSDERTLWHVMFAWPVNGKDETILSAQKKWKQDYFDFVLIVAPNTIN